MEVQLVRSGLAACDLSICLCSTGRDISVSAPPFHHRLPKAAGHSKLIWTTHAEWRRCLELQFK